MRCEWKQQLKKRGKRGGVRRTSLDKEKRDEMQQRAADQCREGAYLRKNEYLFIFFFLPILFCLWWPLRLIALKGASICPLKHSPSKPHKESTDPKIAHIRTRLPCSSLATPSKITPRLRLSKSGSSIVAWLRTLTYTNTNTHTNISGEKTQSTLPQQIHSKAFRQGEKSHPMLTTRKRRKGKHQKRKRKKQEVYTVHEHQRQSDNQIVFS